MRSLAYLYDLRNKYIPSFARAKVNQFFIDLKKNYERFGIEFSCDLDKADFCSSNCLDLAIKNVKTLLFQILEKGTKFISLFGWGSLRWLIWMNDCAHAHSAVSTKAGIYQSKALPAIYLIWTHLKAFYGRWNISTSSGLRIEKQKKNRVEEFGTS